MLNTLEDVNTKKTQTLHKKLYNKFIYIWFKKSEK